MGFYAIDAIPEGSEITINYNGDPGDRTQLWFDTEDDDSEGT